VASIVIAAVVAAAWLVRTDYQVLLSDLKPQDAAAMTAELDRQKIPYQLADGGATILVESGAVHAARLKLAGKEMPLRGAAGFELFNNGDFGMTEFAQKINYQRALQGEITRTILSLAEVSEARVHLALPEEGLFKRANSKPKAAITVTMKAGQVLRPDQVSGIQRLVAAAVPGIAAQDVTIVDQQGIALTRTGVREGEAEAGSGGRLDLKQDTEKLLARKATEVLERAFGAGHAMATVDVTLNMDQVKVTTEDVIGAPAASGRGTGVIVRERESLREVGAPLQGTPDTASRASNTQREVEYQVGRRVEQVVTQPGAIRSLHVAAVVRQHLDDQQLERARALVTAAVGGVAERGDSVVVQTLAAFMPAQGAAAPAGPAPSLRLAETMGSPAAVPRTTVAPDTSGALGTQSVIAALAAAVMLALLGALAWWFNRRRAGSLVPMSEAERRRMARQVRMWLDEAHGAAPVPVVGAAVGRLPEVRP
jgi:flagellar M-ring protein FliF